MLDTGAKTVEKVSKNVGRAICSAEGDPVFYDAETMRVFAHNYHD